MEILGVKVTVIIAIIAGSIWRVFAHKSKQKTFSGKLIECCFVFFISVSFALILLNPVMHIVGIPLIYQNVVAAMLAVSAEIVLSKFFNYIKDLNLNNIIEGYLKSKGYYKDDKDE